jgi:type VI secretion system protein ImpG
MSSALFGYYERELLFIREEAQQFAAQYPAAAGRLLLERNGSIDPHVERLIESFALLTGRIQKKLDDEFPELTDALLGILYPHYLAPIPSMTMVQFEADPANARPEGVHIERGTRLHTQKINGCPCRFRTCYPTTLWPIAIVNARLQSLPFTESLRPPTGAVAALRIQVACRGQLQLADLQLDALRVHLAGADEVVARLYGLIFNNTIGMELRSLDENLSAKSIRLSHRDCLKHVGYEKSDGLLPYPPQSFVGYQLLTELFAFPYKFHFVDIGGWQQAAAQQFGRNAEIVLYLDANLEGLEQEIETDNFRLGCCPAVNLFEKTAEPVKITHTKSTYRLCPDVHHPLETEIYSVNRVTSVDPKSTTRFQPFYGLRHESPWNHDENQNAYWYARRQPSLREGDDGTDMELCLVDESFDPTVPADAIVVARTTCTNRDLPARLQQAGSAVRFQLETSVPVKGIQCVRAPTVPRRPPTGRQAYWRLISHLTLNHLSLSHGEEGRTALQEILRLYEMSDGEESGRVGAVNRRLVDGITSLRSRRTVGRVDATLPAGFCRGLEVTVELDPQNFIGTGTYLFACVLERFLGAFTSINSFSQLVLRLKGSDEIVKRWPPRAGDKQLL